MKEENQALKGCVAILERHVQDEKIRYRELRQTNCLCLVEYDAMIAAKNSETEEQKQQLRDQARPAETSLEIASPLVPIAPPQGEGAQFGEEPVHVVSMTNTQGEAPPVDPPQEKI